MHGHVNGKKNMMFIYRNWVSTRWQRSVNLYKSRKETAIYKRRNNTQNKTKKNTQNKKQNLLDKENIKT